MDSIIHRLHIYALCEIFYFRAIDNSADLQMRHQKLFTLARHLDLSVGHFE